MERYKKRRAVLVAVLVAILTALSLVFSPLALAAPGNIELKKGSITIHKYEKPDWDTTTHPADGSALTAPPNATPVGGVEFSIQQIDLNLKSGSSQDWDKVANLQTADTGCAASLNGRDPMGLLGNPTKKNTDSTGTVAFTDLEVGAYLVCETGGGTNLNIVQTSAPFIVVIPMKGSDDGWNYNVHAYPKNSVTKVEKTVNDSDASKTGDKVSWTVTAKIPRGMDLTSAKVTDTFAQTLDFLGVVSVKAGETVIPEGVGGYTVETSGNEVSVVFGDQALPILGSNAGKDLVVVFETTVNDTPDDGVISNTATVNFNNKDFRSNTAVTKWGEFKITKKADSPEGKALAGAKFKVYKKTPAGEDCTADDVTDDNFLAEIITAGDDGTVTLDLRAWAGTDGTEGVKYCYQESEAPAGYVLDKNVYPVTIQPGKTVTANQVTVVNKKPIFPGLPITGAQGQVILIGAGTSLLLVAAGLALVAYRRRREQD